MSISFERFRWKLNRDSHPPDISSRYLRLCFSIKRRRQLSISPTRKFPLRCSTSAPPYTSASFRSVHDVFVCEWVCERFFLFGGLHVMLLPALCNDLRFRLLQP